MPINILVIDDDKRIVERLMNNLRRADSNGLINQIEVDDSITQDGDLENYDPVEKFGIDFDVVLIDYQLGCAFTGILVSAWMSLKMSKIPRIALTTAPYTGGPSYFTNSFLKRDITDSPKKVLDKLATCIEEFDSSKWLEKQHRLLVQQYQLLLQAQSGSDEIMLSNIEALLDKFEKILDYKQEEKLKEALAFEHTSEDLLEKLSKNEGEIFSLREKLEHYIKELKSDG